MFIMQFPKNLRILPEVPSRQRGQFGLKEKQLLLINTHWPDNLYLTSLMIPPLRCCSVDFWYHTPSISLLPPTSTLPSITTVSPLRTFLKIWVSNKGDILIQTLDTFTKQNPNAKGTSHITFALQALIHIL